MSNTIMIVDDMRLNVELLAQCLSGYSIMPATSGESALKMIEWSKPDLILLDLIMPGIDGFGVLKHIKERPELSGIPVIFVTGEQNEKLEEKGLKMGAVDYIRKPYNPTVVNVKVKNHLELKNYRDNLEALVKVRTKALEQSNRALADMRDAIIMGMSIVSESRDSVTGEHTSRMKRLVEALAKKTAKLHPEMVSEKDVREITLFSPLHDVGKTGISDAILNKPGALTQEEFDIMKTHTVEGAKLLQRTELFLGENDSELHVAIEIAESHHEKFDGSGYPYGLSGEAIPVSARIVSVADVYDALRSMRPYKNAITHKDALKIIIAGDDKTKREHFDPRVLDAFLLAEQELEKLYGRR